MRTGIRILLFAMVGLIAGYALLLFMESRSSGAQDVTYFGAMGLAVTLSVARVGLVREQRLAWSFIAAVLVGNLVAELLFYFQELPYPSYADAIWLLTYPLMFAAVVALLAPEVKVERRRLLLEWLIATLTVSAIAVLLILPAIFDAQPDRSLASAISVAYPIADITILAALIVVLFAGAQRESPAITLIFLAGLVWLISDAVYSYQTAIGSGETDPLLEISWPVALGLMGAAAWAPIALDIDTDTLRRRASMLSGACVLVALSVLVAREFMTADDRVVFFLAIAAVAGGGVRLILAQRENRRLLAAANRDHLTGIPSRAKFSADSEDLQGQPTTVVMIDLDGFKFYNDTFGHPAGDMLLRKISRNLVEAVGESGTVYRMGGDEFCVLLAGESANNAVTLARLNSATEISGKGFNISASLGYADCPGEAGDISSALVLADERMYVKKNATRTSARSQVHEVLVSSLREREPEIAEHTKRVKDLSLAVAREMVTDPEQLDVIERAAELHDVGKVAIPDSILLKPGDLDQDEWRLMKQHTEIGERIISASPALAPVARLVRHSHEHWDGSGYPDGLRGSEIPLGSRIILACDAFEAMTTSRPYSTPLSPDEARVELVRQSGHQFDPEVIAVLARMIASDAQRPEAEKC